MNYFEVEVEPTLTQTIYHIKRRCKNCREAYCETAESLFANWKNLTEKRNFSQLKRHFWLDESMDRPFLTIYISCQKTKKCHPEDRKILIKIKYIKGINFRDFFLLVLLFQCSCSQLVSRMTDSFVQKFSVTNRTRLTLCSRNRRHLTRWSVDLLPAEGKKEGIQFWCCLI